MALLTRRLKIKYLSIFIWILCWNTVSGQENRFIRYYKEGQYLKCLDLADKTIEKEKKNYNALLYKSLALSQICILKEFEGNSEYAAERALKTLLFLKKKDKTDTFIFHHIREVGFILSCTFQNAGMLADEDRCREAIRIYDLLIEFKPVHIYYYQKGKCQLKTDDIVNGGDNLIRAARMIWQDYHKGKLPDPELEDIYTDLTTLLNKYGFQKEAMVVVKRAATIFPPDEKIRLAYKELLESGQDGLSIYSSDSDYTRHLAEIDTFTMYFPSGKESIRLKNKAAESYISFLIYRRDENKVKAFINHKIRTSADAIDTASFYAVKRLLVNSVFEYTKISSAQLPIPGVVSEFGSGIVFWLYHLQNPWITDEQVIQSLLKENGRKNEDEKLAILLANFTEIYHKNEMSVRVRDEFISSLVHGAGNDLNGWKQLSYWEKIYPDNKEISMKFLTLTNLLANQYMKVEKDYGKTWQILSEANALMPSESGLKELSKACGLADYMENYVATMLNLSELNWTGNIEKCKPGTISVSAMNKCLRRLNYFRRMAGLAEPCVFDPVLSHFAQQAAFLMIANNALSHNPGTAWKCYTDSATKAAQNSNLSLGEHSVDALRGQLEDGGEGNYFVGHRRWILNPFNSTFGLGSTDNSMALWCLPDNFRYPDKLIAKFEKQFIAWPPPAVVPSPLVFNRWSFSLYGADLSSAIVKMYVGESQLILKQESVVDGYGLPTLVWVPQNLNIEKNQELTVAVIVENVLIRATGERRRFEYHVTIIPVK